jgi:hypothetical protein
MARVFAVGFGIALVGVALVVWATEGSGGERQGFGVLMLGLKVLSWIFPPLLGLFLVGVLTDRGNDRGNALAVAVGLGTVLTLEFWPQLTGAPPPLAWTWYPNDLAAILQTCRIHITKRHEVSSNLVSNVISGDRWRGAVHPIRTSLRLSGNNLPGTLFIVYRQIIFADRFIANYFSRRFLHSRRLNLRLFRVVILNRTRTHRDDRYRDQQDRGHR